MIVLRLVYSEELEAFSQLFFLTENRSLTSDDYQWENGYLILNIPISKNLAELLSLSEQESIWAPLWVEGLARGFFSEDILTFSQLTRDSQLPEIRWSQTYQQVIWVDRNDYSEALNFVQKYGSDYRDRNGDEWLYLNPNEVSDQRKLVGGILNQKSVGSFYQVPKNMSGPMIESYLLGSSFFRYPSSLSQEDLQTAVRENYQRTKPQRVPGGRSIQKWSETEWALVLDSFDEFSSLHTHLHTHLQNPSPKISSAQNLTFPENLDLPPIDAQIWKIPAKVGSEDLHFELSTYREQGFLNPDYAQYRKEKILNLDEDVKHTYLSKYRKYLSS